MKITHIYAENYKTYRHLDLDLSVTNDCPIILIGGGNGCGKTTLFDAIYHALYGLDIKTAKDFEEMFNSGMKVEQGMENKNIVLEISFNGLVLGQTTPYKLKRLYRHTEGKVQWSVELNMNGNRYVYGIATPSAERNQCEEIVNKIIAANLPSELSNYFLFDAMKTSELVKEEQINRLIMKNINSVMGFNKYTMLKSASESLLNERKAAKLENENQRKEYEKLAADKKRKEEELDQVKDQYGQALAFSTERKDDYERMKQGRSNDETTRDKIKQQETEIRRIEDECSGYRKDMEALMKDLEQNVLFPKMAFEVKKEVEFIINEKSRLAAAKGEQLSEERIRNIVSEVVKLLSVDGADIEALTSSIKNRQRSDSGISEKYAFLNDGDVETLQGLIKASYVNPFLQLDDSREMIQLDVKDLPKKKQTLADYRQALSGDDFGFISIYEENERKIGEHKAAISQLEKDIKTLANNLATFDYDMPQIPDPQFDMLCKLPDFFKSLSTRLLAAKRKNIEDMMKKQLNINLVVYAGVIGRVSLEGSTADDINFKIYHNNGNEIFLSQLNAGAKQTLMQVLLKVLYELGDYNPPVMIDTVMGVLDKESREVILENYFPNLSEQTILLSTDTEITTERDFVKLAPYIAKTYTLHRDKDAQCTTISNDYFGLTPNED